MKLQAGQTVSWAAAGGGRRFGCVLSVTCDLNSTVVEVVSYNGKHRLNHYRLKAEPNVDDAITADRIAIYGE